MALLEQRRLLFSDPGLCKRLSPPLERVTAGGEEGDTARTAGPRPGPAESPGDAFTPSDAEPYFRAAELGGRRSWLHVGGTWGALGSPSALALPRTRRVGISVAGARAAAGV